MGYQQPAQDRKGRRRRLQLRQAEYGAGEDRQRQGLAQPQPQPADVLRLSVGPPGTRRRAEAGGHPGRLGARRCAAHVGRRQCSGRARGDCLQARRTPPLRQQQEVFGDRGEAPGVPGHFPEFGKQHRIHRTRPETDAGSLRTPVSGIRLPRHQRILCRRVRGCRPGRRLQGALQVAAAPDRGRPDSRRHQGQERSGRRGNRRRRPGPYPGQVPLERQRRQVRQVLVPRARRADLGRQRLGRRLDPARRHGGRRRVPGRRPGLPAGDRDRLQRQQQAADQLPGRQDAKHDQVEQLEGRRRRLELQRVPLRGQEGRRGDLHPRRARPAHDHRTRRRYRDRRQPDREDRRLAHLGTDRRRPDHHAEGRGRNQGQVRHGDRQERPPYHDPGKGRRDAHDQGRQAHHDHQDGRQEDHHRWQRDDRHQEGEPDDHDRHGQPDDNDQEGQPDDQDLAGQGHDHRP